MSSVLGSLVRPFIFFGGVFLKINLSDHFTYKKLLKFVMPTIFMMIVTSVYGIVDGFYVSNFVGKNAFAAVNLIMPVSYGNRCIRVYDWYRRKCTGCKNARRRR